MRKSGYLMKATRRKRFRLLPVIAICVILAGGWFIYTCAADIMGIGGSAEEKEVSIPWGTSGEAIGGILKEQGIIDYPFLFHAVSRPEKGKEYKSGSFSLRENMSYAEIVKTITGTPNPDKGIKVVIPEGYESWLVANALDEKGIIKKEDFLAALDGKNYDFSFLTDIKRTTGRLEGYLFPATYTFEKGMPAEEIINQMLKKFDTEFDSELKARAKQLNMTIDQVITLASIIEREAKDSKDMLNVSSVFHNRLKKGQMLESCATVQFILKERKSKLSDKDTKTPSPYNTYMHKGLPPGPIANPGRAALLAALNPNDTAYYYFVLSKDGSHHIYSKTFAEHSQAVRANQ